MTDKERQDALYEMLLAAGDKWTPQRELAYMMCYFHGVYDHSEMPKDFHRTGARRLMTKDIRAINCSGDYEKPILSTSRGIKIANDQEIAEYINREEIECKRKLAMVGTLKKKATANGQYKLGGDIVNSFIGGENGKL